eukprot:CAMPEP_0194443286 /NCGR_PEP_ID=MMETSP0176-20130528/126619_1 /TAXON_ID=216777 /ORGANISM="Proboscia alata, Strain PI-D3" /LENGTH=435 /DNA_ID=CAMNT_0039269511 /DNA_START=263 /DNA_END=1571 /DNA_ORIENTATION=-
MKRMFSKRSVKSAKSGSVVEGEIKPAVREEIKPESYEEIKEDVELANDAKNVEDTEEKEPEAKETLFCAPEEIIPLVSECKDKGDIEAPPQGVPTIINTASDWASSSRSHFGFWECLLMTIALLFVGIVAFSFVFEQWSIDKSLYFTVVTLTTCGYGDLSPTTEGGRLFTSVFAIFGISILAVVIGDIGSKIVEAQIGTIEEEKKAAESVTLGKRVKKTSNKNDVVSMIFSQEDVLRYIFLFLFLFGIARFLFRDENWTFIETIYYIVITSTTIGYGDDYRRFLFRDENWTFIETIYWMVITSTTIGYGDDYPISDHERLLAVVYILVAVGVMGEFLGKISGYIIKKRQSAFYKSIKERNSSFEGVKLMDDDKSGNVSELEYLIFMLKSMDKIDNVLLNDIRSKFKKLDVDGSGAISNANLKTIATKNKKTNVKK